MGKKRVFVLLIGKKEQGDVNHFQLLQEKTALEEGQRLGIDVEVAFAAGFDQLRVLKRRLFDTSSQLDAVVTEPTSTSMLDVVLRELKGKTGLVVLSAWGPSIQECAASWGEGRPLGAVGTNHTQVGEIQGRQVKAFLPEGGRVLCVSGPARSSAAQQRLEGLKTQVGEDIEVQEICAGQWTESDGIVAFNDWYRVAKAHDPVVQVIAGGNDELGLGARRACEALGNAKHRESLLEAKFLGVDGCPTFGERLLSDGTLTASVFTPANTGMALQHLASYWTKGTPVPLRSYTMARPLPAGSA